MARLIPATIITNSNPIKNKFVIDVENYMEDNFVLFQNVSFGNLNNNMILSSATSAIGVIFTNNISIEGASFISVENRDVFSIIKDENSIVGLFGKKTALLILSSIPGKDYTWNVIVDDNTSFIIHANICDESNVVGLIDRLRTLLSMGSKQNIKELFNVLCPDEPEYDPLNNISITQQEYRLTKNGKFIEEPIPLDDDDEMFAIFDEALTKDICLDEDGKKKKLPERKTHPYTSTLKNTPFMQYVKKVISSMMTTEGSVRITMSGYDLTLNDLVDIKGLFPALVMATSYHWAPIVAGRKNKGGFTAHIKQDNDAMLGYIVTGLELSSPLLFILPMIDVLKKTQVVVNDEGDTYIEWKIESLLWSFRKFLKDTGLNHTQLDSLPIKLSSWE